MGPQREDLELIHIYSQKNNQGSLGEEKNMEYRSERPAFDSPSFIYWLHALGLVTSLNSGVFPS